MKKIFRLTLLLLTVAAFVATLALPTKAATTPGVTYVTDGDRVYVHFGSATDSSHFTDISEVHNLFSGADVTFDWQNDYAYLSAPNSIGQQTQIENFSSQFKLYSSDGSTYEYFGNGDNIENSVSDGRFYFTNETVGVSKVQDGQSIYVHFGDATNATTHVTSRTHSWFRLHQDDNSIIRFNAPTSYSKFIIKNATNNTIIKETSTYFQKFYMNIDYQGGETASIWDISDNEDTILTSVTSYTDLLIYFEVEEEVEPLQIQPSVYHMTAAVFGNAININENFILEKIGNSVQLKALNNSYNTEVNGINYINLHTMLNNGIHPINISFGNDTRNYQLTIYERAFNASPVTRITHSIQSINPSVTITDTGSSTRSVEIFDNNTSVATYPSLSYNVSTSMYAFVFLDEMAPIINGQTATVTNVDSPLTETQIRSYLAAWDDVDGDITSQIVVVEDNYTPNRFTIGTWTITYSVTDSSDNESTLVMSVVVSDVVKPTLVSAQNTYTIGYKQTFDVEQLRAQIQASSFDNYDDTVTVVIDSNTYTTNKTVIGTYSVVYSATDTSGNKQTKTIQIAVIDNVAPVINGPSTIAKPKNSVLTESQIRAQLSAYDEISGTLTGSITLVSNDYTGKGSIIGTYLIVYSVSDTAGNVATKQVEVRVIDNLAPFWFIRDNAMIAVENTVTLTREQIVAILTQTGQLTITATTYVSFLQDEYQGNETIPGMYALTIKTTSNSGDENLYNIIVSVYEASGDGTDIIIETPATWFEQNGPWLALGIFVVAGIIVFAAVVTKFGKRRTYSRKRFR